MAVSSSDSSPHPEDVEVDLVARYQLVDGLFAGGPTFALCKKYRWKYFVVLQEDDLSSVHEEFEALLPLAPENHLRFLTGVQQEIRQNFRWMNDISYVDSENREHTIAVIECLETRPDANGIPKPRASSGSPTLT